MPMDKVALGAQGVVSPLCTDCLSPDCTNPIEEHTVSVMGVPTKMRLYVINNMYRRVIDCKGYLSSNDTK